MVDRKRPDRDIARPTAMLPTDMRGQASGINEISMTAPAAFILWADRQAQTRLRPAPCPGRQILRSPPFTGRAKSSPAPGSISIARLLQTGWGALVGGWSRCRPPRSRCVWINQAVSDDTPIPRARSPRRWPHQDPAVVVYARDDRPASGPERRPQSTLQS